MICPKCRREQPDSGTCIFCQIVVEKYLKLHPPLSPNSDTLPSQEISNAAASASAPTQESNNDPTANDSAATQGTNDITAKFSLFKQSMAEFEAEKAEQEKKRSFRLKLILTVTVTIFITTAINLLVFRARTSDKSPEQTSALQQDGTKIKTRARVDPRHLSEPEEQAGGKAAALPIPTQAANDPLPTGTPLDRSRVSASMPPERDPNETHVRIRVVTDIHGGTTDNPIIELFDNTDGTFNGKAVASLVLNKPGHDQPTDTSIYDFDVPHPFCEMVGWRLRKPAASGLDSPWKLKEIYIMLNDELVYMDRVYGRDHPPVSADCDNWCAAGNWASTESFKRSCGQHN